MLQLNQGNRYVITFNVKNADGTEKDLTGTLELKYQLARKSFTQALVEYTLTDPEIQILEPSTGKLAVELSEDLTKTLQSGSYYHEILQYDVNGIPTTLLSDNLRIVGKLIKE